MKKILLALSLICTSINVFAQAGDWKTLDFPDAKISIEAPFVFAKSDMPALPSFMKNKIFYQFSSASIFVGVVYVAYVPGGEKSLDENMHSSIHSMLVSISATGLMKSFNLTLDSLMENDTKMKTAKGSFVTYKEGGEFICNYYSSGSNVWCVYSLYKDEEEYKKIAGRIINSVKIEEN